MGNPTQSKYNKTLTFLRTIKRVKIIEANNFNIIKINPIFQKKIFNIWESNILFFIQILGILIFRFLL